MGNDKTLVEQGPLPQTAGDIIESGGTIQQIQTLYHTAVSVQKPRELKVVLKKCIEEAELAGDLFYYRWDTQSTSKKGVTKKSAIEGPSVKLALAAARNFGNMAVEQRPVQETHKSWIFTSAVIDVETGFTFQRQFRMSKDFPIYGKMDPFRKDDIRFQIGQSKALRNAIINAVPAGLIDKMIETAKKSVRTAIQAKIDRAGGDKSKIIADMLLEFDKQGVTCEMIENKLDLKVKNWDIETITLLTGDLKALISGEENAQSLYAEDEPDEDEKPESNGLSEKDMSPGDPAEHQDIKPETKSKKDSDKQGDLTAGF